MANRLADQKSPYLLQHADNPVDWFPWGRDALEKARAEDKPILVSIGYSACHWCHVMAHESFEDQETAELMNRLFVNIKVDREEHPDVDGIYMEAVQALTGQGGWPLNVFLTPDQRPFFGGTYFPPQGRQGMPSWREVLEHVARAYREQPDDVARNADVLSDYIRRSHGLVPGDHELKASILQEAFQKLQSDFDWANGGFGGAPKFPQPLALELVLRMQRRYEDAHSGSFVLLTLQKMARGGIFDQLGGGFHRYSVDTKWLVPHFEKMLYDNALLALVYLHAWQLTHDAMYRETAESALDYLIREMRSPEGGFYSAEDADSEGVEGKYYVWTPAEVEEILAPGSARIVNLRYGVTERGNFEGKTILTEAMSVEEIAGATGVAAAEVRILLAEANAKLLEARSRRIAPGKDTKILSGWNGLAIRALAEAAPVLDRPDYLEAARQAAAFILTKMRTEGLLIRSYRDGPGSVHAFLEDYAFLIEALISLYEASFETGYLRQARELAEEMRNHFADESGGGFYDNDGSERLLVRPRSFYDNPIPSGNSAAVLVLLRLNALTDDASYVEQALPGLASTAEMMRRAPQGFAYMLSALDFYLSTPRQIAIVGPESRERGEMLEEVFARYLPNKVLAVGTGGSVDVPLMEGKEALDGLATAYVCEDFACKQPVCSSAEFAKQLDEGLQPG